MKWGTNPWNSMEYAFYMCSNLIIEADDSPDLSHVISMLGMFTEATSFNQDISDRDVSNVTDMSHMFSQATSFNQDISSWDVGNVTIMNHMFYEAS